MRAHFGTDGIRGRANENLTVDMAYRIGQYLGKNFRGGKILIGRDTRLSGGMFESALAAGITALGTNACLLGVCSTPELIYLVRNQKYKCGIMITASHNPYHDNGIKIINSEGMKIDATLEEAIEEYIYGDDQLEFETGEAIGQVYRCEEDLEVYLGFLQEHFPSDLSGYDIIIDCANGSASVTAEKMLKRLGARVTVLANEPNGFNINRDCGSTHVEKLAEEVRKGHYDIGLAFDGDADRLIAVASDGTIVDGDKIMFCVGRYLKDNGLLNNGKLVTTVMSNLGLFKMLDKYGIGYEKTQVGDKYVYDCMCRNGYVLGGEQSGHIILSRHATTGDGLMTALQLLEIMKKESRSISELTDELKIYPQLLVNLEVKDKEAVMKDEEVLAKCRQVEESLAGDGRVLVRCSGTEPLVRVMTEAVSDEVCRKYVDEITEVIKNRGY
ncbi:MAG: phosphoglucosamine mutase [Erysipelotrichaceae bacterium]|nr:phosphoglucosamine mutase [Erysipelotrichaceae bacterium]